MEDQKHYLYARDTDQLQISYNDYLELMEKGKKSKRIREVAKAVTADLKSILENGVSLDEKAESTDEAVVQEEPSAGEVQSDKVSVEFSAEDQEPAPAPPEQPETEGVSEPEAEQPSAANARGDVAEVPPIKNEISEHFNQMDESGRLFNIFKQYYTCLNEMCGGTVRVTMKDGFCSLWNYDQWEEFAFVDIFEDQLRIAIDPRYTDALKAQNLCEVPRLLSSRRNVICVKVEDLNNTVLDVLATAFSEVGMQVG